MAGGDNHRNLSPIREVEEKYEGSESWNSRPEQEQHPETHANPLLMGQQNLLLFNGMTRLPQRAMTQSRIDMENMIEERISKLEQKIEGRFKRRPSLSDDVELKPLPNRTGLEDRMSKLSINEYSVRGQRSTSERSKKLIRCDEREIKERSQTSKVAIYSSLGKNDRNCKRRLRAQIHCYRCGIGGHFATGCPMKGAKGCYNCGIEGHKWIKCPRLKEISNDASLAKTTETELQTTAENSPRIPSTNPANHGM